METELPKCAKFITEIAEPNLPKDLTERLDPICSKPITDIFNTDPTMKWPCTLHEDPNLAKLLTDIEDPPMEAWAMLILEPNRAWLLTDIELPK